MKAICNKCGNKRDAYRLGLCESCYTMFFIKANNHREKLGLSWPEYRSLHGELGGFYQGG